MNAVGTVCCQALEDPNEALRAEVLLLTQSDDVSSAPLQQRRSRGGSDLMSAILCPCFLFFCFFLHLILSFCSFVGG